MGKIQGGRPHNDYCRKRFIELSEVPGNEELRDVINKEFESITKRYLSHEENVQPNKRIRHEENTNDDSDENAGVKRTGSKVNISQESNKRVKFETEEHENVNKRTGSKVKVDDDEPAANKQNLNIYLSFLKGIVGF